jgi:serine/threonine protein kinase/Tfp pilus assembly protein PilF
MDMPLSPDTRLGRYEIRSLLGKGGMGDVYLAWDSELERTVALKLLPADVAADQQRMSRFVQEARAASSLNHPNILTIYDIGRADSIRFIATEFIEGETLRARLKRARLTLGEALDICVQVASALAAAHEAGIVHRDIKPDNIMLRKDGIAKVLDFGLAKLAKKREATDVSPEAATRALVNTEPGLLMGTPLYMSPEQARGLDVDARTDIWSLGCVLYEMMTGRPPFSGATNADIIAAIMKTAPVPLASVTPEAPAKLEEMTIKALEKDREERYQTAKDLLVDLRRLKRSLEAATELERTGRTEEPAETSLRAGREQATAENAPASTAQHVAPLNTKSLSARLKNHKRVVFIVLAAFLIGAAALSFYLIKRSSATNAVGPINSIAVLPFINESHDTDTEYLSDGITESLINSLSQLPNIKVIARSSVFRYKGQQIDPQQAARELNVQAVLTGRVILRGDTLSISAELMDARDNHQLWGDHYTRKLADIFAVQDEIARQITDNLRLKLSGAEQQQIAKRYTGNVQAFEDYMQGRSFIHRRTREDIQTAISYYQKAIAEDQNYALAYAGLAEAFANLGSRGYLSPVEGRRKAEEAVQKALALDENLAEAHVAIGEIFVLFAPFNFPDADRELHHALELSPSLAAAHQYLGNSFVIQGRLDEALAEFAKARELDPLSAIIPRASAAPYYLRRDYARALALLREANKLGPPFTTVWEIGVYIQNGSFDEALAELDQAKQGRSDDPILTFSLGRVSAAQGKRAEALQAIKELESTEDKGLTHSLFIAQLYAALNDKEQALSWLERGAAAWEIRWFLKDDPDWDIIRNDPRFTNFVRRVGLSQ